MAEMDSKEFKKSVINGLIEQGKKNGMLMHKDIALALEEIEVTPEEIDAIYEVFEKKGIEVVNDLDKELEEIEVSKEELEDLSIPEGISIDDHVKSCFINIRREIHMQEMKL